MIPVSEPKLERLHLRCDAQAKQLLEKAAAYQHETLSAFILTQALASAQQVIETRESIPLTPADFETFLNALENPPAPNNALRRAFEQHQTQVQP
jgi:uncharacterized protein (DUF1778 family)